MRLPFFGGSYKGPSTEANPQECVNYIPELDNEGGLHSFVIRPGLTEVADLVEEALSEDELVTNGDFATDSDWTKSTTQWTISAGKLRRTPGNGDPILGPELLTNGDFDGDASSWTLNTWAYNTDQVNIFTNSATYKPCTQVIAIDADDDVIITIGVQPSTPGIIEHQPSGEGPTFNNDAAFRIYLDGDLSDEITTGGLKAVILTSPTGGGVLELQGKGGSEASYDLKIGMDHVSAKVVTGFSPEGADNVEQVAADMAGALTEGATYRMTFTVDSISGGYFRPSLAGTNGDPVNASGEYSIDIVAGSSGGVKFAATVNLVVVMDDVSIKEVNLRPVKEIRGIRKMGTNMYIVQGDQLKRLDSNYENETTLTTSTNKLSTNSGPVTMAHNFNQDGGLQLMICDGTLGVGYIYDTDTEVFTRISEDEHEFFGGGTVAAQDGFFISNRPGTHEFYTSAVNDGLTWDSLDVTTAEAKTSPLSRMLSAYQNLWAFKGDSTEQFYNSGQEPLFQRTSLALIELGLAAVHSVALLDNAILWLADDRTVRLSRGGATATVVSTYHIARVIERLTTISDAIGIGFMFNNHALYVLTFPADEKTLVYDISNNIWSEWKSYKEDGVQDDGRFRANCYTEFNGDDVVGDYRNNKLYKIGQGVYADDEQRIRRVRVFRGPKNENLTQFMGEFELDLDSGMGLNSGQGVNPQAMLQISKDGGQTYGREIWAAIGRRGKYATKVVWRRLGQARNPVFKVTISDPIPDVLVGAYLDAEQGYD